MEELSEDSFYFFYKANLIDKLDFKKKLNSGHDINSTEERWRSLLLKPASMKEVFFRFWIQVDPMLLPDLNMSWAYKNDFEMFDYSFEQYLLNFNIKLWTKSILRSKWFLMCSICISMQLNTLKCATMLIYVFVLQCYIFIKIRSLYVNMCALTLKGLIRIARGFHGPRCNPRVSPMAPYGLCKAE